MATNRYKFKEANVHGGQAFVLHCISVTGSTYVFAESVYDRGGIPSPPQALKGEKGTEGGLEGKREGG
jgi:hypothetical protein